MKVHSFCIAFPLAPPGPGRKEEEINKCSRNFRSKMKKSQICTFDKYRTLTTTEWCKSIPACLNFRGLAPASLSNQPQPAKSAIFGKIRTLSIRDGISSIPGLRDPDSWPPLAAWASSRNLGIELLPNPM